MLHCAANTMYFCPLQTFLNRLDRASQNYHWKSVFFLLKLGCGWLLKKRKKEKKKTRNTIFNYCKKGGLRDERDVTID